MRKKIIPTIFALVLFSESFGQLTITDCYQKARLNYPSIVRYDLIDKSKQYNLSNANSGYLPQISLSGKVSYQSHVTQIPISMPGIEGIKNDQYNATLDINQSIWDGGVVRSNKESIKSLADVDKKSLDVELYSLNERINQIYFGVLLFNAQLDQNRLYVDQLQRNYDKIHSCVQNGVAEQSDLDAVKVEQLTAMQTRADLSHSKTAYIGMLSALIGQNLNSDVELITPAQDNVDRVSNNRPELELFAAQKKNLDIQNRKITADLMPKLGAYVSGGYGRPGLNMLSNDFSPYYTVGARLSWTISGFYNTRNSRLLIQNNIKTVDAQEKTFLFNSNIDIDSKQSEIAKYRDQMQYDDQIISLRESVSKSSESKMLNGTISGIDFMRDVTAENMAKQDKIYHKIELLLSIYNLKYLTNNL